MKRFVLLPLASLLLAGPVTAETAYVTDMLTLDMYATADMIGAPIRKLRSGDQMEVLERNGRYAKVRFNGLDGWVKSLYLVDDEPARTRVNQLEKSNEGLEGRVKKLRSQLEAEQGKVSELQQANSGELEQRAATENELNSLREENQKLATRLDSYAGSLPLTWVLVAVVISLLGGGFACWYWIDKRSRDRHGGYRVY